MRRKEDVSRMALGLGEAFDPRGRLSRRGYGRLVVRAALAFAALLCVAVWLAAEGLRHAAILAFGCTTFVALAMLTGTARRLHDRDRSAWWVCAYLAAYAATFAPIEDAADSHPLAVFGALAAILGFFAWYFTETFLRRGTPGVNRFGPEPP